MAEVLGHLSQNANPDLLVGFDTSDDAGVFLLPGKSQALVQTLDFFTPVVDDPFTYGQIAATNALSDVYAMGGDPITVMNIACFDPSAADPSVWADVLLGMQSKTQESGAICVGGHTVEDSEPKFGMAVTGLVDPSRVWSNRQAVPGDQIWLSKPLGTGIVNTAAKFDKCDQAQLDAAILCMTTLNKAAKNSGVAAGVKCATDITGYGLAGHLFNICRGSGVQIELEWQNLPLLPGIEDLVKKGCTTGGATRNQQFLGENITFPADMPTWLRDVIFDPQTSGGLAMLTTQEVEGSTLIGRVTAGSPAIRVL